MGKEFLLGNIGVKKHYYSTSRETAFVTTAAEVWALYDALMEEFPDRVTKKEIHSDDNTFTNYVYEISTGEYSSDALYITAYGCEPHINKPKYLVESGIHGTERKTVYSTYQFIRDVVRGNKALLPLREGAIISVLPVATPSAFNNFLRQSGNAVDINRNFNYKWVSKSFTDEDGNTYTYGTAGASEKETQAIVSWMNDNRDAKLFIDFHNNGQLNEKVVIIGLPNNSMATHCRTIALKGIDKVIPHWKDVIGYPSKVVTDSMDGVVEKDVVYAYSSTAELNGAAFAYAHDVLGIPSIAIETAAFYGNYEDWDTKEEKLANCPEAVAMGAEALGNILAEFYVNSISSPQKSISAVNATVNSDSTGTPYVQTSIVEGENGDILNMAFYNLNENKASDELPEDTFDDFDESVLSQSYIDFLNTQTDKVNKYISRGSGTAFFVYGGAKWKYNHKGQSKVIKYASALTDIHNTSFLGGILCEQNESGLRETLREFNKSKRSIPDHHSVISSVDVMSTELGYGSTWVRESGSSTYESPYTAGEIGTAYITCGEDKSKATKGIFGETGTYCVDDSYSKTRYVYLDTATTVTAKIATDFLAGLATTPERYKIVVLTDKMNPSSDVSNSTDTSDIYTKLCCCYNGMMNEQDELDTTTFSVVLEEGRVTLESVVGKARVMLIVGVNSNSPKRIEIKNTELSSGLVVRVFLPEDSFESAEATFNTPTENNIFAIVETAECMELAIVPLGRGCYALGDSELPSIDLETGDSLNESNWSTATVVHSLYSWVVQQAAVIE